MLPGGEEESEELMTLSANDWGLSRERCFGEDNLIWEEHELGYSVVTLWLKLKTSSFANSGQIGSRAIYGNTLK